MSRERSPKRSGRWGKFGFSKFRMEKSYGALDLGTYNCRPLIARPTEPGFRVATSFSRIVRLGEVLSAEGCLSEAAMDRTLDALLVCSKIIRDYGVTWTTIFATEACRRAVNCSEFLNRVERVTGLILKIIPSKEEAPFAMVGCQSLLTKSVPYVLVFNIGGGSTELI